MWMASFLTIPLYKLMCNLSYIDVSNYITYKEIGLHNNTFTTSYYINIFSSNKAFVSCYNSYTNGMPSALYFSLYSLEITLIYNIECSSNINAYNPNDVYFDIRFYARVSDISAIEFTSLQDNLIISPGETGLVFFRLYNPTAHEITGISLYFIYPHDISIYIQKIQCFCFDMIRISTGETIELPVLFYLDNSLLLDNNMYDSVIYISYIFFLR